MDLAKLWRRMTGASDRYRDEMKEAIKEFGVKEGAAGDPDFMFLAGALTTCRLDKGWTFEQMVDRLKELDDLLAAS